MTDISSNANDNIRRKRYSFWMDRTKPEERDIEELITIFKEQRIFTQSIRQGLQLIADLREGNLDVLFELFPWVRAEFLEYMRELQLQVVADDETAPQDAEESTNTKVQQASDALRQEQQQIEQLRAEQEAYQRDLEHWAQEREKQIAAQWEHIEREKERLAAEREKNQSAIEQKLEKLEQLLIQQGNQPIERPSASGNGRNNSGGPQPLGGNNLPPPTFDDEDDADLLEVKESEGGNSNASMNFIKSVQRLMDL